MPLSNPLRVATALALSLSALLVSGTTVAGAPAPTVEHVATEGTCAQGVDVIRWTPDLGPPARFVADTYIAQGPDIFIALGVAQGAFWAVEGVTPSDACDDCALVDLVATSLADGSRRVFPVLTQKDRESLSGASEAAVHAKLLGRLFHLAAGLWPAAELRHDYRLRLPERNADGTVKQYKGWLVEVKKRHQWTLRFDLGGHTEMCWCFYAWGAKRIAPQG